MNLWHTEKKAGIELREGPYEDVKKVYYALTPEEKNFVTPGRTFYKDVPYTARRVAYDGDVPVGFADLYGLYEDGSPRSSQNLTLAVSDAARGRRVARSMVDEAIEAAVARARQKKNRRTKIKRIIWSLLKENEASARAAANSGFIERLYDKPHSYRRFVKDLAEKQAQAFSQDGKTVTLSKGQTPSHVVAAYNKAHPGSKITVPQFLKANGNLAATKFRAGKAYSMPVSSPMAAASAKPAAKPAPASAPAAADAAAASATAPAEGPLGFRQNNPGNLRSDGKTLWQGATGVPAAGEFLSFSSPYQGVRAMARTLFNYGRKHKIDSLEGVVKRYAPAKENNQAAYLASVRQRTGLKPGARIDLTNEATLQKLVPAMGAHEIGPQYFSTYNPSLVSNAVTRATSGR